ncbi:MAG: RNA methyltransferase [Candidatus Kapaibacterium sp.]|jgi:tRNA G18 (ribose-2'-O)-methylase SpoU
MIKKLSHDEILSRRLTPIEISNAAKHPIILMLYNIRSLYNVGSLFRTADSALIEKLILCGYTPHPPRKEIEKTALGAVDTVNWEYYKDTCEAVNVYKAKGYKIAALEITSNSRKYNDLHSEDFPLCIIAGNELSGVSDDVLEMCDYSLEIPMYGVKHSLNVSVAAGISVFAAVEAYRCLRFE